MSLATSTAPFSYTINTPTKYPPPSCRLVRKLLHSLSKHMRSLYQSKFLKEIQKNS